MLLLVSAAFSNCSMIRFLTAQRRLGLIIILFEDLQLLVPPRRIQVCDYEHDISNELSLEVPFGNGECGRDACPLKGRCWGLLLYQSETAMSGETEAKGDWGGSEALGKGCWNSLEIIIPMITNLPPF